MAFEHANVRLSGGEGGGREDFYNRELKIT